MANNKQLCVNLDGISYYAQSRMFINILLSSNGFGDYDSPWSPYKGTYGTSGYPQEKFGITVFTNAAGEAGVYSFSCTGHCTSIIGLGQISIGLLKYDAPTNKTTASITALPNVQEFHIKLTGSNLSNMKLLRPTYTSDANVFTNDFIKAFKIFGAARFMDTQNTNNSTIDSWSKRSMPTDFSYSEKGISYEHAITLGNLTGKDIYLHIPHMADDDFIANFAKLVKEKVSKSIKCYVEYSNEVWNSGFTQCNYNINKAIEESKTDKSLLITKKIINKYYQGWCRTSKMTVKISKALDYPNDTRFRPVLATQLGNTAVGRTELEYISNNYGAPNKFIFGFAGAPYFGNIDTFMKRTDLKVEDFFSPYSVTYTHNNTKEVLTGNNFMLDRANGAIDYCNDHFALAKQYDVVPMGYESGLDVGQFDVSVDVKIAAQADPRMGQVHKTYWKKWFANGGGQLFHYKLDCNYSKWGCWGLTDSIVKLNTPKMTAAIEYTQELGTGNDTNTPTGKYRLSGVTYADKNNNGKREGSEAVPNATVRLLDSTGKEIRSVVSDKYGFFLFNGVVAGNYQLVFDKTVPITMDQDLNIDLV